MDVHIETARSGGNGAGGGIQSGSVVYDGNSTPSPVNLQIAEIAATARDMADARARIDQVSQTVQACLKTMVDAKNAARRSISESIKRQHHQRAADAAHEAGRVLGFERAAGAGPMGAKEIETIMQDWQRVADVHLQVLSRRAAFWLSLATPGDTSFDTFATGEGIPLQCLTDFERLIYSAVWQS